MKTYLIILILVVSVDCCASESIYVFVDQYGNKQFSDTPPQDRIFTKKEQRLINTVKWHKLPKLKATFKQEKTRKQVLKQQPSKTLLCAEESKQIKQLENKLKQALKAQLFDELKKKLRNLRWQHQKRAC